MLTLLAFNSYSQNTDVKGLLDNQKTRTEIFNTIAGDHELMMDFMKVARENEHAMMMMKGNNPRMEKCGKMEMTHEQLDSQHEHQMMGHGDMIGMMKENPEMMQKMMGNMMDMCKQDSAMCNKMAAMMTDSPEMMEMCMKKMKEKGMMGPDGKMKMMQPEGKSTGKEHSHQH